jgi:3-oxoadipate enol-lactonase
VEIRIPVDGGEIWAADSGAGPALILIHPGWGDAEIWSPLLAALGGQYRVIRYDDRGYGRSPAPAGSFTRLADLQSVLDQLRIPEAVLVGHSGGGGTALALSLTAPERVSALVLIAPGCMDYPWPGDDPFFTAFDSLYRSGDRDGLAELGMRTWAPAGASAAARAQVSSAVAAFFAAGEHEQPEPPVYQRLSEVSVPSVMIRGDLEYPMAAACSDQIAARIPGCRRVVIHGADHLLPLRAPGSLAELIVSAAGG